MGGSPCQGFSFSGKGLNFNDPRSILFFEYVRLLEELNPKYFLLENVRMKQESQDVISKALGVEPVFINSASFSAQDRKRLYWTNIDIPHIQRHSTITFKDILEYNPAPNLFLKPEQAARFESKLNSNILPNKSCVIGTCGKHQGNRVFDINCKAASLSCNGGNLGGGGSNIIFDPNTGKLRRISPIECERLQTLPDNYTEGFGAYPRYKMLGNGWTVNVISHILNGIQ